MPDSKPESRMSLLDFLAELRTWEVRRERDETTETDRMAARMAAKVLPRDHPAAPLLRQCAQGKMTRDDLRPDNPAKDSVKVKASLLSEELTRSIAHDGDLTLVDVISVYAELARQVVWKQRAKRWEQWKPGQKQVWYFVVGELESRAPCPSEPSDLRTYEKRLAELLEHRRFREKHGDRALEKVADKLVSVDTPALVAELVSAIRANCRSDEVAEIEPFLSRTLFAGRRKRCVEHEYSAELARGLRTTAGLLGDDASNVKEFANVLMSYVWELRAPIVSDCEERGDGTIVGRPRSERRDGEAELLAHLNTAERVLLSLASGSVPECAADQLRAVADSLRRDGENDVQTKQQAPDASPGYTVAALREMTGLQNTALNAYAKAADVSTPGRGKKNFRYSAADAHTILSHILEQTSESALRAKCREALENLTKITK